MPSLAPVHGGRLHPLVRVAAISTIVAAVVGLLTFLGLSAGDKNTGEARNRSPSTESSSTSVPPPASSSSSLSPSSSTTTAVDARTEVGSPKYLKDLKPFQREAASVEVRPVKGSDGEDYAHGVTLVENFCRDSGYVEYDLSRDFAEFEATVTFRNDARSDIEAIVTVYVDGSPEYTRRFSRGIADRALVKVAGALTLRLEVTDLSRPYCPPPVVFGNAQLLP